MNARQLQKYLLHLCICVVACAYAALSLAVESDMALHAPFVDATETESSPGYPAYARRIICTSGPAA